MNVLCGEKRMSQIDRQRTYSDDLMSGRFSAEAAGGASSNQCQQCGRQLASIRIDKQTTASATSFRQDSIQSSVAVSSKAVFPKVQGPTHALISHEWKAGAFETQVGAVLNPSPRTSTVGATSIFRRPVGDVRC